MKVQGSRIIIAPEGAENTTASGLIIEKEEAPVGVVVVARDSIFADPWEVGTRVLYRKYSGTEVKINGERRVILEIDDILATLDTDEKVG